MQEQFIEAKNRGYEELIALCESLDSAGLRLMKEWWMNPTTELFSGWENRNGENRKFSDFLNNEIKLRRTQDFFAKLSANS